MPTPLPATPPAVSSLPSLRIGLIGFGTVGSSFAEVLAVTQPGGPRITHVFNRGVDRKRTHARARHLPHDVVWSESIEDVLNAEVDCIVELIGGLDPAEGWLRTALSSGKHVVTANKQLIAYRGAPLFALAAEYRVQLLYGAAVAGGVPVIPGITQGLSGDRLTRISGIVNGTCNFILSAMEAGAGYEEVLIRAQNAGYAEANPSADVDGFDARAKLCILARLALQAELNPDEVPAQSIARVSAIDFAYAKELGCTVRQISQAQLGDDSRRGDARQLGSAGTVRARVGPMLVARTSPLAWSHGTQNMVVTSGHFGGDVVFSGHGAGGHPTAVAVLSDVLRIQQASADGARKPVGVEKTVAGAAALARHHAVSGDVLAPFYLRFVVQDRPGIVAAIAGTLAEFGINLDSILQHRGHPADRLPFVVTTEPCLHSTLERAIDAMDRFEFLREPVLAMQILVPDDPDLD